MKKGYVLATVLAIQLLLSCVLTLGISMPAHAQSGDEHVKATLFANVKAIQPGKPFKVAVELAMVPGWHTYYKEPGDAGMPTKIIWSLPTGFSAGQPEWEKPNRFEEAGIVTYGYHDHTVIATTITPSATLTGGGKVEIGATVKWLACKDLCVPGQTKLSISLPIGSSASMAEPVNQDKFQAVGYAGQDTDIGKPPGSILERTLQVSGSGGTQPANLAGYLLLAFVGGFILNFMPCVLPVISIKILSFMEQAGEHPKRVFQLGAVFSAGIIGSFMALAAVVIAVQQAGDKVGWGFQFQYPGFVLAMAVVVLLFALSLFGLFYINIPGGQSMDKLANQEGFAGTFFKGVLATVLATPCTAPFLGTALGFAFTQSWPVVLAVFFTISLGMSCPYLVLTAHPGWMKHIPRPGKWMEVFKESMGFILLATVIWLLWILGKQSGAEGVVYASAFLVVVAFAAWLIGRLTDLNSSRQRVYSVWAMAAAAVGVGYYFLVPPVIGLSDEQGNEANASPSGVDSAAGIAWRPFTIASLDEALSNQKTVLIDFTAEWCLTCKVNEQTVINTPAVINELKALKVVTFKADWTRKNPVITKLLAKFSRSGVPLYVIFPAGRSSQPIVLPEVITQSLIIDKLAQAGASKDL